MLRRNHPCHMCSETQWAVAQVSSRALQRRHRSVIQQQHTAAAGLRGVSRATVPASGGSRAMRFTRTMLSSEHMYSTEATADGAVQTRVAPARAAVGASSPPATSFAWRMSLPPARLSGHSSTSRAGGHCRRARREWRTKRAQSAPSPSTRTCVAQRDRQPAAAIQKHAARTVSAAPVSLCTALRSSTTTESGLLSSTKM